MKIGFTGTQIGMTPNQFGELARLIAIGVTDNPCEFHHGDCIGADAEAHSIADAFGCRIVIHPPTNTSKEAFCKVDSEWDTVLPPKPYLDRNHDIVDACDVLLAAPKSIEEELRSGTWATVRYARKKNIPVIILEP